MLLLSSHEPNPGLQGLVEATPEDSPLSQKVHCILAALLSDAASLCLHFWSAR